jgi:hypothetical protein
LTSCGYFFQMNLLERRMDTLVRYIDRLREAVNTDDEEGVQHQGERTWYVYDVGRQRVRKVTELATGQVKDEHIFLGGFEIYRRQGVNTVVRETLHIMDEESGLYYHASGKKGKKGRS